jgi:hypothetical protein
MITITADGECLMWDGFSLGETVHANYFSGMSLSPRTGDAGAAFMGSTQSGPSTPWRAMIDESTEEFLMASSVEGSFSPPLPEGTARGLYLL